MDKTLGQYRTLFVCIILIITTFAVYWPVWNYDFVEYDDDDYISKNRYVKQGINAKSVRWAFTTSRAFNWHPVTWLSHMADCELFGLNAGAHHIVNVLLHVVNALLLFVVLKQMTNSLWPSAFVASLFALHPLHVESVAWVAERKDVLSTFFWLLTMLSYFWYVQQRKAGRYLVTLLLFALGLMAKPMLVTLPLVLLLLDYWPLERLNFNRTIKQNSTLLLEKVPFFGLSAISCIVTFLVQRARGAMHAMEIFGLKNRLGNAIVAYVAYIQKMFYPVRLAVLYPHPGDALPMYKIMFSLALLALLTIVFIYLGRHHRFLTVGWLWYLGTLIPVIGIVQVGIQSMADRYTYIPLTGLFIIIAWGVSELTAAWPRRAVSLAILAVVVLLPVAVCARDQLRHWKNSASLFRHTLDVTRDNFVMHNNYANFLKSLGKIHQAIEHLNRALELKPNSAEVHNNLGSTLIELGRIDEAVAHCKKAVALRPNLSAAHYNLAVALAKQGKTDEAIAEYRKTLQFAPDNVDTLNNLGYELAQKGYNNEAVKYYNKALELEPDNIITHGRLGLVLANVGRIDEAIKRFQIVLKARPSDFEMHFYLGILLLKQGKTADAIKHFQKVLEINPKDIKARQALNELLKSEKKLLHR